MKGEKIERNKSHVIVNISHSMEFILWLSASISHAKDKLFGTLLSLLQGFSMFLLISKYLTEDLHAVPEI